VVDELRQRQRMKTLDFVDFLEALTRYTNSHGGNTMRAESNVVVVIMMRRERTVMMMMMMMMMMIMTI
jgi:hypothetical protein